MSMFKTTIPNISVTKANGNGDITKGLKAETWKKVLQELQDAYTELHAKNGELATQNTLNGQLNSQNSAKDTSIEALNTQVETLQQTIQGLEQTVQERDREIVRLNAQVQNLDAAYQEAKAELKDAGKFCASEQDATVKKVVSDYIIEVTFQTVKFARDDQLKAVVKGIYDGVASPLGISDPTKAASYMSEDEFARIYTSFVTEELNKRRQYVQTQLLAAFQSKSNLHLLEVAFCCVPDGIDYGMLWLPSFGNIRRKEPAACCYQWRQGLAKGNFTLNEAVSPLIDWTYSNLSVFSALRILQGKEEIANYKNDTGPLQS